MAEPDEDEKFRRLVKEMRAAQRCYFATRGGLDECKKLEREVDRWLKKPSAQPGLPFANG